MNAPTAPLFPHRIASPSGLSAEVNGNGSIRRMDHGDIMLNLFLGNEMEGGLANIYLRLLGSRVESIPLTGPGSPAVYEMEERGFRASGVWRSMAFRVRFVLAESRTAWFWHVEIENKGAAGVRCDLIHTQDVGLAHYGAIRLNEYYVSQYVDHTALAHESRGCAVASRQNQSMGGRCPWTVIGSLRKGVAYATDALQFHGLATRGGGEPAALASGLPGRRLQHEHSMVCLQEAEMEVEAGGKARGGFFGLLVPDKPEATSQQDAQAIDALLELPEAKATAWPDTGGSRKPGTSLFASAPLLEAQPLVEEGISSHFGAVRRHAEEDREGMLSFFCGDRSHVVLQRKERKVLRPHGHILRSGGALVPDESALTSTVWMAGVFHSMVTQGHVSINRFLSTCHTYLGLFRSHGQRVFVELGGEWMLLDVPSAFEIAPDSCHWIYQHRGGTLEVVSSAPDDRHELHLSLKVLEGDPVRFLISHHVAMNGDDGSQAIPARWENNGGMVLVGAIPDSDVGRRFPEGRFVVKAAAGTEWEATGGDELLFADGRSRGQPYVCMITRAARTAGVIIEGRLLNQAAPGGGLWSHLGAGFAIEAPRSSALAAAADRAAEMFPWFIQNALVHYLSPRGLEQYSGGGWGTRDVCQGPVELLLALGRFEHIRDLLCRVFRQQNEDGDWPQWFMFFDRERNIRPGDSHGDIVYWPIVALAEYLSASGDAGLLDEKLPYFHAQGDEHAGMATVWEHAERALDLISRRVIPGTRLAAYGHGDWNDSLQPAKPDMRERLCSAWTVTLSFQMHRTLAAALRRIGHGERAVKLEAMAHSVLEEFQRTLIVDEVIAGFAYFHENGKTDYLLHPRDRITGLSYSVLAMIHAIINDMLTPDQAARHLKVIRSHLMGPDGARLFDKPLAYHGGPQKYFQRAESASFFGREIGIMYTHAHLRYCEALARHGEAEAFFHALCQINPIAIREIVPSAALRQANCYFSSSDAAFADRYEAYDQYAKVNLGTVPLEGGWRVYSSGAGICVRLIMQCFLGIRKERDRLVLDPVVPPALDGLRAHVQIAGHPVEVIYRVRGKGVGPLSVRLNDGNLSFTRAENAYRRGGAVIPMESIVGRLTGDGDAMTIALD